MNAADSYLFVSKLVYHLSHFTAKLMKANKRILYAFCILTLIICINVTSRAAEADTVSVERNSWGGKLIKSPFGLGLDVQTKYVWRGMEMMTEDAAPVLFPSVNYSWRGLYVYFMGGYAVNGKYAEVDAGISYTLSDFTFGIYDYYYPTVNGKKDEYVGGGKHTGHWLEACLSYNPSRLPLWVTISNFFYGADKYTKADGKETQAYSTYLEVGTYYDFLYNNRISFCAGAALNKSCYNNYEHDFSVCNLDLKYTYSINFNSGWTLPLSVEYIYNPVFDKSFVNFIANLTF